MWDAPRRDLWGRDEQRELGDHDVLVDPGVVDPKQLLYLFAGHA